MTADTLNRRDLLVAALAATATSLLPGTQASAAARDIRVTGFDLIPVRATHRTVWLFVRLETDAGLTGLGEASDAFGFANTTRDDVETMRRQLKNLFRLIEKRPVLEIEAFRQQGFASARTSLVAATAYSAIEQALWDLAGQALEVPTCTLLGGRVRDAVPVYANVNRAVNPRTPEGFATAASNATGSGFRAVKAAPFDGFPSPGASSGEIRKFVDTGIAAVAAMRDAVGPDVEIMIDCHSNFTVELAIDVARRLEALELTWYEEPVPPGNVDDTVAIRRRIAQPMAGGELLFGVSGFAPLIRRNAFDVIMPDVKHCGGLLELTHIAAMARNQNILVAPHNPSGPVSTAASAQICAVVQNVNFLELQYGEVDWRSDVLTPAEAIVDGTIGIPDKPGFGVSLNEQVIEDSALPL